MVEWNLKSKWWAYELKKPSFIICVSIVWQFLGKPCSQNLLFGDFQVILVGGIGRKASRIVIVFASHLEILLGYI